MTIVAVAGDTATTTAVALASAWPISDPMLLVEADPTGGDLAAWFDMPAAPSLSTVVTRVHEGSWDDIEQYGRVAGSGLRLIPAPSRAAEAVRAVAESSRSLVGSLGAPTSPVAIADVGDLPSVPASHPFVAVATVTVVVHRQAPQSPNAAAVRLQRLADQLESLASLATAPIVAIVGGVPFGLGEIEAFLADSVGTVRVVGLPVDELAASVLAGRSGVSARRLGRLPLLRASRDLALVVEGSLDRRSDVSDVAGGVS
jgi:MinD-like ATPase involved in chromosome partitioning or flagellar assembly